MKNRKIEIIIITILIIIQTIIIGMCGIKKSYIHMDEAYSLGLASYDKVEIQENEDFYDKWHDKEYYEDYLCVNKDEIGEYKQVYVNQKNDVHPPLYYLFLRIAMGFSINEFSKWPGIIINMIIYGFITYFMYLILQKLLKEQENAKEKSIILAFVSSITMASLTSAIYIRMYALSTLNVLITTYLHMKLYENKEMKTKILICIGISALVGSLTHYYYLFYLAMMYIIFAIKYIKEKNIKKLGFYTLTMSIAGITSILIFPFSIQHMFFGYRGQGAMSKMTDMNSFLINILAYIEKINRFVFNGILFIIIIGIIMLLIYKKNNVDKKIEKNKFLNIIEFPTLFYFILVAVSAPWVELRYIMPICGIIFILIIYYLYELIKNIFSEKIGEISVLIVMVLILISPIIFKIVPEVMYSDKSEIVSQLNGKLNLPTIYCFNTGCNRFLDDILLFAKLNESYIAKDIEYTEDNIKKILDGKDVSNGMIVFINEGQENDSILENIKNVTELHDIEYLKRLNACDVYYIK